MIAKNMSVFLFFLSPEILLVAGDAMFIEKPEELFLDGIFFEVLMVKGFSGTGVAGAVVWGCIVPTVRVSAAVGTLASHNGLPCQAYPSGMGP
jgi:hypothetical protein